MSKVSENVESERARLREGERRHRVLSEISATLLDYVAGDEEEPLRRIVDKVVEGLGDWCAFSLIGADGILRQVAAYHPDPRQRDLAAKLNRIQPARRWDKGPPETNVLVQKRPLVFEQISKEMLRAGVQSEDEFRLLEEIGLASAIVAPLMDGSNPLGSVILASAGAGGRRYTANDIDFVVALADRASLAVRNARLVRALAEERDRQRVALEEAERRAAELWSMFEADPNGLLLFDPNDRVRYVSRRMLEMFHWAGLEQFVGRHYEELFQQDLRGDGAPEAHAGEIGEILSRRDELSYHEMRVPRSGRWLSRTSAPVRGTRGEYLGRLFVYVDITAQKELDNERAEFLTVAAHELRTPLTPLSMYLQNIERRLSRGLSVDPELAVKSRRQVNRLTRLVEDLLDVSRLESGRLEIQREPVHLDELIDEVVGDFRSASHGHEIVLVRPPQPLVVSGDRQRLEQVLVNLLQNAIKYSPQGGQVAVTMAREGDEALVSVADQGIGIPVEEQQRVFQRFFRARNAATRHFGGLGIGLFVSHEIVQRHGGRFMVESQAGKGAIFSFTLPLLPVRASSADAPARIPIVDDDPEVLEATGDVLREWGYAVDAAADGTTALELARIARPDLMLVDLMMPVMDGSALIARLRNEKLAEGIPIVVMSADRDACAKGESLRADASLRKPFELEELQGLVERLLPGRVPAQA
ncbi:MAG TPA: ATP-binding protein [Myxococcales bacterium]|nr:ATP-binding protein [Myxococcales bacterium]